MIIDGNTPIDVIVLGDRPNHRPNWREFEYVDGHKVGAQSMYFDGQNFHTRQITCVCGDGALGGPHHHVDGVVREMPKYVRRHW